MNQAPQHKEYDDEEADIIVRSSNENKDENDDRLNQEGEDTKNCFGRHRRAIVFWAATTLFSLAIILFLEILDIVYRDDGIWIQLYGTEDVGGSKWCEAIGADLNQFMIEPWNSRSDYAFVAWGCFLMVLGVSDFAHNRRQHRSKTSEQPFRQEWDEEAEAVPSSVSPSPRQEKTQRLRVRNPLLCYPHITLVNGVFNILHGLGSFWNHACECGPGGKADVSGMLSVTVFPLVYIPVQLLTTPPLEGETTPRFLPNFFLSTIPPIGQTLFFVLVWFGVVPAIETFTIVMGCTVAVIPLSFLYLYCWRNKRIHPSKRTRQQQHALKWWLYPVGLLCFGLGHLAWQLDVKGIWCFQTGILLVLQGHVVWHLLCGLALVCVYALYRSEQVTVVVVVATTGSTLDVGTDASPTSDCVDCSELPLVEIH